MKRVLKVLGLLLVLALAGGMWAVHRIGSGPRPATGERTLPGLTGPVDVLRDSLGIPQIFATSIEDAVRAQGWVHARDRLWQMEMFRRVSQGRLSEMFGEATVDTDRFLRMLDMNGAARLAEAALTPEARGYLEAYVGGVNAAVESWPGFLPPEFVLLGVEPEPFTITDVLAIEKIMSWDLAEYGLTLSLLDAARTLGVDRLEEVRPRYPTWGSTIIPGEPDSAWTPAPVVGALPSALLLEAARIPDGAEAWIGAVNAVHASNSWVVGGDRSASGKPVLSNDMHLSLDQPNIWYLVGVHAPGLDVVGMSLPGTPMVVAGHSASVAWGLTNAMLDDTDLVLERVDPADTTRYLTESGSLPFEVRTEEIVVKGRDAPETLVLRRTRNGPIITPVEARAGDDLLAFKWVAHQPSTTIEALFGINRAENVDELLVSLRGFTSPHQNFVFADTAGAWGYWLGGSIPNRRTWTPPILPLRGWTGEAEWDGFVPFEEHPHVLAPEQGFIATGNNRQGWDPIVDRVTADAWFGPWRADRITELLHARDLHDARSLLEIQLDVVSTRARANLPFAVEAFRAAGLESEADALAAWDAGYRPDATEPFLFEAWMRGVTRAVRDDIYDGGSGYLAASAVDGRIHSGSLPAGAAEDAARAAVETVAGRTWGEVHTLTLDHPLASVPLLERLFRFGRKGMVRAGGPETVNVASYGADFTVTYGPSERHVVDLGDLDGAGGFILPGGQSGLPRSRHADDQLPRWERGELARMPISRAAVEARTVGRLVLRPGAR